MIFQLLLNTYRMRIVLATEGEDLPSSEHILLSKRDPEVPVEFKPGPCYFNPLLKKTGAGHLFIVNGDNALVTLTTGKAFPKLSKKEIAVLNRGWFLIPPMKLEPDDITSDIRHLIVNTPQLTGVIAQVARTSMGLRIPTNLNCVDKDAWITWITSQHLQLIPRVKMAFNKLITNDSYLIESRRGVLLTLETGQILEKTYTIRFRWAETKDVLIKYRQIRESMENEIEIPESIAKGGEEEIVKFLDKNMGSNWRIFSNGETPSGVEEIERSDVAESVKTGALIWYRPSDEQTYVPLYNDFFEKNRIKTVNDYIQQILDKS